MSERVAPGRIMRASAALTLVSACVVLGAVIGWLAERLFVPAPMTGWDGIADATVGLIVGGSFGLVAGGYLASGLSNQARWWSAAVAVLLAAGTLWSLALTSN